MFTSEWDESDLKVNKYLNLKSYSVNVNDNFKQIRNKKE